MPGIHPCLADKPALRVGFIGGFSGAGAVYGQPCRNGFELGINAVHGAHLKVIYEDDQFVPAKTIAAFHKLVEVDGVDVIIVLGSIPGSAVAPLIEQAKIPAIAWTGDSRISQGRSWIVRSWTNAAEEGKILAREAINRGYNRIAILSAIDNYSRAVIEGIKSGYTGDILESEEYAADVMDFRSVLAKLKAKSVSQVALCMGPGQSAAVAKQAVQLGLKIQFFGCETLNNQEESRLSNGGLNGTWFTTVPVEPWFRKLYKQRYGNQNTIGGAAVHYDLARLLSAAPTDLRGQALIQNLLQVKNKAGATGTFSIIKSDGEQHFELPVVIRQIRP